MDIVRPEHITVDAPGWCGTGYNEFGEEPVVVWVCVCGSSLELEFFDDDIENYRPISDEFKAHWVKKHDNCNVEPLPLSAWARKKRQQMIDAEFIEF